MEVVRSVEMVGDILVVFRGGNAILEGWRNQHGLYALSSHSVNVLHSLSGQKRNVGAVGTTKSRIGCRYSDKMNIWTWLSLRG